MSYGISTKGDRFMSISSALVATKLAKDHKEAYRLISSRGCVVEYSYLDKTDSEGCPIWLSCTNPHFSVYKGVMLRLTTDLLPKAFNKFWEELDTTDPHNWDNIAARFLG